MEPTADAITARVRHLRDRAGLSLSEFARALDYKGASSVQRYEDPELYKGGYLRRDLVAKIARTVAGRGNPPIDAAEVWELAGPEFPSVETRGKGSAETFPPLIVPGRELVGDRNLPIYAAARGSKDGHQIVTFEAIEYVKRPAALENVKDGYGIYVVGESMIPAFEPGDMALVHPHLPPARNKNVVLYHNSETAETEAMIKRLIGYDDRDWRLHQFNPPEGEEAKFSVSRSDWTRCHRIVGKYDAR